MIETPGAKIREKFGKSNRPTLPTHTKHTSEMTLVTLLWLSTSAATLSASRTTVLSSTSSRTYSWGVTDSGVSTTAAAVGAAGGGGAAAAAGGFFVGEVFGTLNRIKAS